MVPPSPIAVSQATLSSYSSSYQPRSPRSPSYRQDRSPSPSASGFPRTRRHSLQNTHTTQHNSHPAMSHRVRHLLTPRIISPIIIWSVSLWLIHHYLLALPLPHWNSKPAIQASDRHLSTSFPPPLPRQGEDWLDSIDPLYRPLAPLEPPEAPFPRLRPTRFLPSRCLESWFMDGETICGKGELGPEEKLDATWLWVNGSDERWREEMVNWRTREGIYSPEHHFREQNELVYSMRSVLAALEGHLRTFHLIVYDYAFDVDRDIHLLPGSTLDLLEQKLSQRPIMVRKEQDHDPTNIVNGSAHITSERSSDITPAVAKHLSSYWRVAQTPSWLDFSMRESGSPKHPLHPASASTRSIPAIGTSSYPDLRYASHSEIFHLPSIDRNSVSEELGEHEWREQEWRKKALPTFNSMSIESRIGWLPGLADVSLSLNDDFFILRPHAVSDFDSPLYGNVIRFDHGWYQQVRPILDKSHFNDPGEMGGLYHANYLLSQRFPRRLRPYFAHAPKVITRGLHHEASLMFKEALAVSSSRRFRELSSGEGDVQMQWMLTLLRVERWREALLWTFIVANIGGADGSWDDVSRSAIDDLFGLGEGDEDVAKIEVHRGERWTIESERMDRMFDQAGWEAPKATDFLFSSMDGHLPPNLKPDADPSENDKCIFDLDRCFGSFWQRGANVSAADMFKRMSFQYPECGDCLIMALVTSSGPLGLSAFFPTADATYTNDPSSKSFPTYLPPPHLPLTSTWQEADFSLRNIMSTTALPSETVNLRQYTMKLLSRYLYMSARSDSHFHMLKDPEHANRVFAMIEANPRVSILGLNDDIERGYEVVKDIMNAWFNLRWPKKSIWERGWGTT